MRKREEQASYRAEYSCRFFWLLAVAVALPGTGAVATTPDPPPSDAEHLEAAAAGPKKHQRRQKRPIKLGTSGGSVEDFTIDPPSIICCGGTLGALLEKKGQYYVLSNNHVLARFNRAEVGEPITQPSLTNNRCEGPDRNVVGTFTSQKKLKLSGKNKVDAAIAETSLEDVSGDGEILVIGVPGNDIVAPKVGAAVVKSGRTTGFTKGEVTATNVEGVVEFAEECRLDSPVRDLRFTKVFLVESVNNKNFSDSGDSGSVIYERVADCPRAMGLLFAGSGPVSAANPMKLVMKAVKKMKPKGRGELVGCTPVAGQSLQRRSLREERAERRAMRVQRNHQEGLLALPGVHAIGLGRASDDQRETVVKVFVESSADANGSVPENLDGIPVEVVVTPKLRAFSGCSAEHPAD